MRIAHLDGWRAVAITLVIVSHWAKIAPISEALRYYLEGIGVIGVDVFFSISGYVITRGLLDGDQSLTAFYVRRACRILPPLALYLIAVTSLAAAGIITHTLKATLGAALFLCNTSLFDCGWYTGHIWSLSYEEQFYAVFPAILFTLMGRPKRSALAIGCMLLALPFFFPHSGLLNAAQTVALLAAGAVCAITRPKPPAWVAIIALILLASAPLAQSVEWRVLRAIMLPLAVCALAFGPLFRSMLASPVLTYIGRISYSIYLWQQLALSREFSVAQNACGLAGVVVLSAVSYATVERFFIRLGHRWSGRNMFHGNVARGTGREVAQSNAAVDG